MEIRNNIPTIETIFDQYRKTLGADYNAYKNHVYRVINFCEALSPTNAQDNEKIVIAGCFHDMGIWTNNTFDYLSPSSELAKNYLIKNGKAEWFTEIDLMIHYHHKITAYRNKKHPLVEIFRKADWIDVTKGKRAFGLSEKEIKVILDRFPNKEFHKKLIKLTKAEFRKKPFRALPMMKW